jgi:hypothetical protein
MARSPLALRGFLACDERPCPEMIEIGTQRFDTCGIDGVNPATADRSIDDEVGLLENAEVLGNGRATDWKVPREFTHRQRTFEESDEDRAPCRIAQGRPHTETAIPPPRSVEFLCTRHGGKAPPIYGPSADSASA